MASSPKHTALALVLLCAAIIMVAPAMAGADVDSYSYPVFNANTTDTLLVTTKNHPVVGASLLFQPERPLPEVNVSEGFLLLDNTIDVWLAGAGGVPSREASFNTSFTVESSASPVSFVIFAVPDGLPTSNNPVGLRGVVPNATVDGLVAVQVGTVKSYAPQSPDTGLNVTVTPNGTVAAAVWIQYDAVAHALRVYVGVAGGTSSRALVVKAPLSLTGQPNTQTAFVGFFAGTIRDIFVGVRDWDLTVDSFDGKKNKKGTSWWVILVAVLGSVAATAAIISVVVWCCVSRRRTRNMEPKI